MGQPKITHCYGLRLRGRLCGQLCERSLTRPVAGDFDLRLPWDSHPRLPVEDSDFTSLRPGAPTELLRFAIPHLRRAVDETAINSECNI
jgi:hypothetical protein